MDDPLKKLARVANALKTTTPSDLKDDVVLKVLQGLTSQWSRYPKPSKEYVAAANDIATELMKNKSLTNVTIKKDDEDMIKIENLNITVNMSGVTDAVEEPAKTPAPAPAPVPIPIPAPVPVPAPKPSPSPVPAPTPTNPPIAPYGQDANAFNLVFADEFDAGFNTKVWNDTIWYEASNPTKNYTVENGSLKIWPAKDASGKFFNRTIDTDGKYYQKYGYFEIEAKCPIGKGTWPAFWLFNHIDARRPEIDVMEAYAGGASPWGKMDSNGVPHPTMYAITVWEDANKQVGFHKQATVDLSVDFHKYALKWEPNKLTFYFDGQETYSVATTMSDQMYLMLDLWYGSASGQPDDAGTPVGKDNSFEIKYIRAWQFK